MSRSFASHPLYTVAQLREIEQAAKAGLAPGTLMQRAGKAAADLALTLIGSTTLQGAPVLVLAGPGDNGGDALHVAAHLAAAGCAVEIILVAGSPSTDAQQALALARASTAKIHASDDDSLLLRIPRVAWRLAVDGLFGIGLARPISGRLRELVEAVNRLPCPVLALDVPSGLDADTGTVVGPDGVAIRATQTISFIGDKPGLHTGAGCDYAGTVSVDTLDIEDSVFASALARSRDETPLVQLGAVSLFAHALQPRRNDSHKGSFGDVKILGGATGMAGAVILAARSAAYCGAGRVFAGFLNDPPSHDSLHPELMCRLAANLDLQGGFLVVGPGLGQTRAAHDLLAAALAAPAALVLDADALNLIAQEAGLANKLRERAAHAERFPAAIMTPHPLEAARLLSVTVAQIQSNRLQAARALAQRFMAITVLKGAGSVMASPDGRVAINPTGNPGLATGGTGDVLAGLCGALLAQSWNAWEAALGATWIHGAAADMMVAEGIGPTGLTASELPAALRKVLNQLIRDHASHPRNTAH
ncbi:MAG: bifunctional ADP-dependent NAD(P)H-hydrate dehydratase/NAD(P)H-hydrate epimerase [Herminiimonas sp.]|nr:bifunctional ADP-dependent NAD(P)H-hydrate dehydratase/NAD(P)H-hydrate epimerase [Herminiimonas sp.]